MRDGLIDPDDLHVAAHPVRRQVYATAVAAGFDQFFDHLLTVDLEFDFRGRMFRRCFTPPAFLIVCHDECPSLSPA